MSMLSLAIEGMESRSQHGTGQHIFSTQMRGDGVVR